MKNVVSLYCGERESAHRSKSPVVVHRGIFFEEVTDFGFHGLLFEVTRNKDPMGLIR